MKNSDCFQMSITIMSAMAVWIPDSYKEYPKRFIYLAFALAFHGVIFFAIVMAEIAYLVAVFGDTKKSVDAMVLMLSHLVQSVKLTTILTRQNRMQRLIAVINGPAFTRNEGATREILENAVYYGKLINKCAIASAGVTALFWNVVPLLKSHPTLPLLTAYPFDVEISPRFEIMYLYTAISVALLGVTDAAMNFLVSGLLILAGAQLDVLAYELEHITVDQSDPFGEEIALKKVVNCIQYHQRIISYVEELGSIFGTTMICQFLISSIVICLTVFEISLSTEPIELTTMIFYLICVFMELLMYCFPGDLVLNKSLAVAKAAYSCDWVSCDLSTRRLLLMLTVRAQRAVVIKAGGVYPVSLPTAEAVVHTAYSYYAVLKQTQRHDGAQTSI